MIYVHVPFCRSFCTYCDFYSEICSRGASQQVQNRVFSDYADAVTDEIRSRIGGTANGSGGVLPDDGRCADPAHCGQWAPSSYDAGSSTVTGNTAPALEPAQAPVTGHTPAPAQGPEAAPAPAQGLEAAPETLYFGGGTPSVLPLDIIGRIVKALGHRKYEEFTVEVNPDDIVEKGVDYIRGLTALGVNRISMGVQSFDDSILRWMNRRHDAQGARDAVHIIREGGVRNLSIDLIFGLSMLTEEQWRWTIAEALKLHPEHISAYQLSIEEGSALGKLMREGRYTEAGEDLCRSQYDILCEELARAGFVHYEISNWALPGHEAIHNSAYWRRVPYVGLGPGAHSMGYADGDMPGAPTLRSWNTEVMAQRRPDGSLGRWSQDSETLGAGEVSEETVMLALRTAAGIGGAALRRIAGDAAVDAMMAEGGLIALSTQPHEQLRIPESRFFVSDDIIASLLP